MGLWVIWLIIDMLCVVESWFGCGGLGKCGFFGKLFGGYGLIVYVMKYVDVWLVVVCYLGDMVFELCYLLEMLSVLCVIVKVGFIEVFVCDFEKGFKYFGGVLYDFMIFVMVVIYDFDFDLDVFCGICLLVDLEICEIIDVCWNVWFVWDFVYMVVDYVDVLKLLKMLWIDCGNVD